MKLSEVLIVKTSEKTAYIVETKGREDLDDPLKIEQLRVWCKDVNTVQQEIKYIAVYVKQEEYAKYKPKTFPDVVKIFSE